MTVSRPERIVIGISTLCGLLLGGAITFSAPVGVSGTEEQSVTVRLLFVGDIMLDRTIREAAERRGYSFLFKDVEELFSEYDFVIGNLEGPITTHLSVSKNAPLGTPENTRFTFEPASASALAEAGISVLNLGNNHIVDFGLQGWETTQHYLEEAGIQFFGGPAMTDEPLILEKKGMKIALISFNAFGEGNEKEMTATIWRAAKSTDAAIVYAHWGEEYQKSPTKAQRMVARRFLAAGADFVVGGHPHVVQHTSDDRVFYSLGNFVFDQYWSEEVRCGMGVSVLVAPEGIHIEKVMSFWIEKTGAVTQAPCLSRHGR